MIRSSGWERAQALDKAAPAGLRTHSAGAVLWAMPEKARHDVLSVPAAAAVLSARSALVQGTGLKLCVPFVEAVL